MLGRPAVALGQRVRVAPGSALYAGTNWPGLTTEHSTGYRLKDVHGIVRGEGRRGEWLVQWFGPDADKTLYTCQQARIYACTHSEWRQDAEDPKLYPPLYPP